MAPVGEVKGMAVAMQPNFWNCDPSAVPLRWTDAWRTSFRGLQTRKTGGTAKHERFGSPVDDENETRLFQGRL